MTTKDTSGPAFPVAFKWDDEQFNGMTLRDWFAGKAMQGLLAQSQGTAIASPVETAAVYAYAMADAMLAERNKQ